MKMRPCRHDAWGVLVIGVTSLLAACASETGTGDDPTTGPGRPPDVTPAPTPLEGTVVITEVDSGERFVVSRRAHPLLRLTSEYLWEEPRAGEDSVELVRVDYFQDPGFFEWELRPVGPGTTVIIATGRRDCPPPETPCPDEPLEFEVAVTPSHHLPGSSAYPQPFMLRKPSSIPQGRRSSGTGGLRQVPGAPPMSSVRR